MHAGIDLTLIMPRNERLLGSNSVCVNTRVSLSECVMCMLVCKEPENIYLVQCLSALCPAAGATE